MARSIHPPPRGRYVRPDIDGRLSSQVTELFLLLSSAAVFKAAGRSFRLNKIPSPGGALPTPPCLPCLTRRMWWLGREAEDPPDAC